MVQIMEPLPVITVDKGHISGQNIIRVVVGIKVQHPNTIEHHIARIEF